MKKSDYKKLLPLEQAAIRDLIRDTPTALHTKQKDKVKPHSELPLFAPSIDQELTIEELSIAELLVTEYLTRFKEEHTEYWLRIKGDSEPLTNIGATLALTDIIENPVYSSLSIGQQKYLHIRFCELCNESKKYRHEQA